MATKEQLYEISQNAEEVAEILENFVNNMALKGKAEIVAKRLAESHRTLQQASGGLALTILLHLSQNSTDLRNEYIVRDAKRICELLDIHGPEDIAYLVA